MCTRPNAIVVYSENSVTLSALIKSFYHRIRTITRLQLYHLYCRLKTIILYCFLELSKKFGGFHLFPRIFRSKQNSFDWFTVNEGPRCSILSHCILKQNVRSHNSLSIHKSFRKNIVDSLMRLSRFRERNDQQ